MELGALKQRLHCHKASLGGALLQKGPEVKWAPTSCSASFSFSNPLFYFLKESQRVPIPQRIRQSVRSTQGASPGPSLEFMEPPLAHFRAAVVGTGDSPSHSL